jgi:hypothetical protein
MFALVAVVACASHAQRVAKSATQSLKAEISQIDPAIARTLGDHAARGAVTGALAELSSEQQRALLDAMVHASSEAAAQGILTALSPDSPRWQQLVDRTMASAIGGLGSGLAADTALRDQLAAITHQASASAVYGARDALADIFPECTGALSRRRCIDEQVSELSRAAARGVMAGFVGGAGPLLALVFLAGAMVTLLFVRARSGAGSANAAAPGDTIHAPQP